MQVVHLAREMGLVKRGTIAMDGIELNANASRHKAMSYGHMRKAEAELKAQIDALLKRAQQADEAEKNEAELDIPAEIARREARLAAITGALQRLEQRQRDTHMSAPATSRQAAGATSASSACPRTRRRTASPTRAAAS